MGTTVIGNPRQFAVEYDLQDAWPPYGRARLWLGNIWFGDLRRSMFLYHMASSLRAIMVRDRSVVRRIYMDPREVPGDDELLAGLTDSWGESFDDFAFVTYAVEVERAIHFVWKLDTPEVDEFTDYPLGPHHARVPYPVFDEVVTQFVRALAIP